MTKYVLLTGATGLVGRYLLRDLLLDGHRVAVLVRAAKPETPTERIESILQYWEEQLDVSLPRPAILEGDVTEPSFGLDADGLQWVRTNCDRILHNAAVLTFYGADRDGEPWRTNLNGTRNTLSVCERLGITEFHYVSTAYVCGTRRDLVREDELDVGQSFRNDYEHSKFLAESMVRESKFIANLTVYRPTVIAGDSVTGYTSTYHGLYMYLKLIAVICRNVEPGPDGVRFTPVQLQMTGDEPRNIVPVDWVSAVISRVVRSPDLHGRTYHLAPFEPITPRQIIEAGYGYYNSRGVEFSGPSDHAAVPVSTLDQAAKDNMTMYESYETTDPDFDSSNIQRYLPDLPCPKIDEEMLHRFWRFGEQDRWGKRRWPKAVVPFHVEEYLEEQVRLSEVDGVLKSRNGRSLMGVNVHGPGGGQWQVEYDDDRLISVTSGLPGGSSPVVQVSSCDFSRLVEKHERLTYDMLMRLAANHSRQHPQRRVALTSGFSTSAATDWIGRRGSEADSVAAASRVVDGT